MLPQIQAPLSRHLLFRTSDLDCAREMVARKFCRHRLEIVGEKQAFNVAHHHFMGEMISLNYIDYGADVVIEPGTLESFYLVQIPLAGFATIRNGLVEVQSNPQTATILNPQWETRMRWSSGCRQILVQIRKSALHTTAARSFNRDLPGEIAFNPEVNLNDPNMARWLKMVKAMFRSVDEPHGAHHPGSLSWHMHEQMLVEQLLWSQPSNIAIFRPERREGSVPRYVKRAEEFIRSHADQPVTLADIAEAAGCTSRTLQLGFQSTLGTTPLKALRVERLRRVRFDLTAGEHRGTIADIAMKWGFGHLGRFASEYRDLFGELPHQTRYDN